MPTTRRRRTRPRQPEYTVAHECFLLTGHAWFDLYPYGNPTHDVDGWKAGSRPFDEDACRADWEAHREALLAYDLQDPEEWRKTHHTSFGWGGEAPGGPGSRPWAWWQFEAPEPRPIVGQSKWPGYTVTVPRQPWKWSVAYEPERAFLERHGLLSPEEITDLAAFDARQPRERLGA